MRYLVLGPMRALVDGGWEALAAPRQRVLLGVLLANRNRVVTADQLVDVLWGEAATSGAIRTLRSYVSRLRDWLEPDREPGELAVIGTEGGGYVLRVGLGEVDADLFEALAAEGAVALSEARFLVARGRLVEALELWRGEAFEDFRDDGFARGEAVRLNEARLVCVERRIEADLALGRHVDVLAELRELTAVHPLREGLWCELMVALYRSGRQADALRAFGEARRVLREELGIEPGRELCELEGRILRHELPAPEAAKTSAGARGNVPERIASVVGRASAISALGGLVVERRLVTLVGFGGVGKTTLALEVARESRTEFSDGVWVARLGAVSDPMSVVGELASTLGAAEHPARSLLEVMVEELAERHALVVIDNCEHVIDEVRRVVETLLSGCRGVRVLATSREPLHVVGEQVWPVHPLAVPDDEADPFESADVEAVELFIERAREADPSFVVDNDNVADVIMLCRRLDGVPLAIELAAARLRVMSPSEVLERLDDRFALLASPTTSGRHSSLSAAIDWSYDLLDADARTVFGRVGVFEGGFSLEAAQTLCSDDDMTPEEAFDLLARLVDVSLLTVVTRGRSSRFAMLEAVHDFARAKLSASGTEHELRRRHAAFYAALVPQDPGFDTEAHYAMISDLESDYANQLSALKWTISESDGDTAARLAASLTRTWIHRGRRDELLQWCSEVVRLPPTSRSSDRAEVLASLGFQLACSGHANRVEEVLDELRPIAVAIHDPALDTQAAILESTYLEMVGRGQDSLRIIENELNPLRRAGHPDISLMLVNATWASTRCGAFERAADYISELEVASRRFGQDLLNARVDGLRGMLAHYRGDLEAARRHQDLYFAYVCDRFADGDPNLLREMSAVELALGDVDRAATLARQLIDLGRRYLVSQDLAEGHILHARADFASERAMSAIRHADEASRIAASTDDLWTIVFVSAFVAQLARAFHDPTTAVELHAAAERSREALGYVLPLPRREELDCELAELRVVLDSDAFEDAWRAGASLDRAALTVRLNKVVSTTAAAIPERRSG